MTKTAAQSAPTEKTKRKAGRPTLSDEALLDTALELFIRDGFERTGIDVIAATAGMAKRTVYARYPDKTALFKAALQRAIEDWLIPIDELRATEDPDIEKTLFQLARKLLSNVVSPMGLNLLRLSNAVSISMPEIAAYNTRMGTEPTLAYLADLFRRRLLPAEAPKAEADAAALAFLHLVVGGPASNAAWGVTLDDTAVDLHTRYCVRLFLHGALPDQDGGNLKRENRRLKTIVQSALHDVERAHGTLQQIANADDRSLTSRALDFLRPEPTSST